VGLSAEVDVTSEWKPFRFVFLPSASDDNARVNFSDLASQAATVWLAGASFRPGGAVGLAPGERIENDTLPPFSRSRFSERSAEGQRDWLRFLWETEDAYWQTMQRYLKEELKVRGVVIGTIVGCSTPNLMARLDAVDTHAYWQHPHFPGRPWDPENWVVANRTMVNEPGGTLPDLALRRVAGKPAQRQRVQPCGAEHLRRRGLSTVGGVRRPAGLGRDLRLRLLAQQRLGRTPHHRLLRHRPAPDEEGLAARRRRPVQPRRCPTGPEAGHRGTRQGARACSSSQSA
jgi:hypothetical protein